MERQRSPTTTGAANVSDSHCQLLELQGGDHGHGQHRQGEQRRDDQPVAQRFGLVHLDGVGPILHFGTGLGRAAV